MTIAYPQKPARRTAQGVPFTSLSHDDIHDDWYAPVCALIDFANAAIAGTSLPPGAYITYAGTVLPTGFLWCNGAQVSQVTYANLYAAIGTTWNTGVVPPGSFCVPDLRGKVPIGTNPMGGLTNGSYSTRNLATVYGAESYTNASVAVTGNTPAIVFSPPITIPSLAIPNTVTATMVNPAIAVVDTIAISAITATITNPAITVNNTLAVSPVTASIADSGITVSVTETGGGTTIAVNSFTPTLNYGTCVQLAEAVSPQTFPPCDITVNAVNATVNKTAVTGAFTVAASIDDPSITVGGGILSGAVTASIVNPAIIVGGGTKSGTITASITNSAITVGGTLVTTSQGITPSITVPSTALSGVTASINVPTLPPSAGSNYIIKI